METEMPGVDRPGLKTPRSYLALLLEHSGRFERMHLGNRASAAVVEETAEDIPSHDRLAEDIRCGCRWGPCLHLTYRYVTTERTRVSSGLAAYWESTMRMACRVLAVASKMSDIGKKRFSSTENTDEPSPPILPKLSPLPWPWRLEGGLPPLAAG